MKKLINRAKKLKKDIDKEASSREKIFLSKSVSWQESVTGDKYQVKTDCLREMSSMIDEALSAF
jgi:hypothetical protein